MIDGCLASKVEGLGPTAHPTFWSVEDTPSFLQEKKDYGDELRWMYRGLLQYLGDLSTYAKLPNMSIKF